MSSVYPTNCVPKYFQHILSSAQARWHRHLRGRRPLPHSRLGPAPCTFWQGLQEGNAAGDARLRAVRSEFEEEKMVRADSSFGSVYHPYCFGFQCYNRLSSPPPPLSTPARVVFQVAIAASLNAVRKQHAQELEELREANKCVFTTPCNPTRVIVVSVVPQVSGYCLCSNFMVDSSFTGLPWTPHAGSSGARV